MCAWYSQIKPIVSTIYFSNLVASLTQGLHMIWAIIVGIDIKAICQFDTWASDSMSFRMWAIWDIIVGRDIVDKCQPSIGWLIQCPRPCFWALRSIAPWRHACSETGGWLSTRTKALILFPIPTYALTQVSGALLWGWWVTSLQQLSCLGPSAFHMESFIPCPGSLIPLFEAKEAPQVECRLLKEPAAIQCQMQRVDTQHLHYRWSFVCVCACLQREWPTPEMAPSAGQAWCRGPIPCCCGPDSGLSVLNKCFVCVAKSFFKQFWEAVPKPRSCP